MDVEPSGVHRRAAVHAALGDPTRLAVVDALLLGDASPSDLGRRLGVGSNLLAHHLRVLAAVGLVERVRSEGDGRRAYACLVPEVFAALGPRWSAPPLDPVHPRVVFVCRHNSARSQLAAAQWARCSGVPVASAGTHPAGRVHPGAVAVGRRHGLALGRSRPRAVRDVLRPADLVISVCDVTHEDLAATAGPRYLHWSVPDPVRAGTEAAFERAYAAVATRVARLAAATAATAAAVSSRPSPRAEETT